MLGAVPERETLGMLDAAAVPEVPAAEVLADPAGVGPAAGPDVPHPHQENAALRQPPCPPPLASATEGIPTAAAATTMAATPAVFRRFVFWRCLFIRGLTQWSDTRQQSSARFPPSYERVHTATSRIPIRRTAHHNPPADFARCPDITDTRPVLAQASPAIMGITEHAGQRTPVLLPGVVDDGPSRRADLRIRPPGTRPQAPGRTRDHAKGAPAAVVGTEFADLEDQLNCRLWRRTPDWDSKERSCRHRKPANTCHWTQFRRDARHSDLRCGNCVVPVGAELSASPGPQRERYDGGSLRCRTGSERWAAGGGRRTCLSGRGVRRCSHPGSRSSCRPGRSTGRSACSPTYCRSTDACSPGSWNSSSTSTTWPSACRRPR